MGKKSVTILVILMASACSPQVSSPPKDRSSSTSSDNEYYTSLPLKELMHHVIDYSAEGVWKWEGWVSDKNGQRALFPTNDEEWEQAESAALTLAEVTNVLLLPGRRVDDPRWSAAVEKVRNSALAVAKAAEDRDQDRFFHTGSGLDDACESCHLAFVSSPAS